MVRRVNVTGEVKHLRCEAAARASLNRAYEVGCIDMLQAMGQRDAPVFELKGEQAVVYKDIRLR